MQVTLNATAEEFVRRKLAAGHFESAEEVVSQSLELLERCESDWREKIEVGWKQAQEGQLSGPDEVRAWMKSKKAEWLAKNSK